MPEHTSRTNRRQKKASKKEQKKQKRAAYHPLKRGVYFAGRLMRRTVLVGLLAGSIAVTGGIYYYQQHFEPMVSAHIKEGYQIAQTIDPSHFEALEPTVLLDADGNTLRVFRERNYHHLDLQKNDELYKRVSNVTTSIEDERFYQHKGVDYFGIGVAVFESTFRDANLRGASTLTQQIVKNKYLSQEQTLERKITEAVIAQELEQQFSKREILEFYVNDAYFGRGNYGMETAARYYFGKPTEDLNYRELSTLISIPNNPTIYDPINNPDNTIRRRNLSLRLLAERGIITEEERAEESEKDLELDITPMVLNNQLSDWAESFAVNRAVEEIMRWEGFEFEYWHETNEERAAYRERYNDAYHRHLQNVLRGGYVIETSIQPEMQTNLQRHVDQNMARFTATDDDGVFIKQAPSVVIDNRTNEVAAIVGGRTQDIATSFNRGFQSARQPGSAIKPFLSFAPAFERGLATGTIREDKAIENGPSNVYDGYRGNMTLRRAMVDSVNTIAYNLLLQDVGVANGRSYLEAMEFSNLRPEDRYPTMAVGGWTQGTSPLDLAAAFNTLTNDGLYYRPHNVRKVTSSQHQTVYFDRAELEPERIYESGVGYVTLNTLQTAMTDGTGARYDFDYAYQAGKTGTTNDVRELWFVGGSPHYSMALYVGDDNPTRQDRRQIDPVIQTIFSGFMREAHQGVSEVDFHRPSTVIENDGNLWVRTAQDTTVVDERQSNEAERQAEVRRRQSDRLASLAYRIEYGLNLDQAKARERVADSRVITVEHYQLGSQSEDLTAARELRDHAQEAIDEVVRADEKSALTLRLTRAFQAIEADKRANVTRRERAEQEERERIEREQEEQERIERERQEQEEREQEKARREAEERQEEERRQREAQEQEVDDESSDVAPDEPVEDEDETVTEEDDIDIEDFIEDDDIDIELDTPTDDEA